MQIASSECAQVINDMAGFGSGFTLEAFGVNSCESCNGSGFTLDAFGVNSCKSCNGSGFTLEAFGVKASD